MISTWHCTYKNFKLNFIKPSEMHVVIVVVWMVTSQKICLHLNPQDTWTWFYLENVFASVTQVLKMMLSWIIQWDLNPITSIFMRDRRGKDTDTEQKALWRWGQRLVLCSCKWRNASEARSIFPQTLRRQRCPANTLIQTFGVQIVRELISLKSSSFVLICDRSH